MGQGMMADKKNDKPNKPFFTGLWREALLAMTIGWEMALPIFAGVLIGQLLDRLLQTTYIFTIGLIFAGIAMGYYNLVRLIQRLRRQDRLKADQKKRFEDERIARGEKQE
jgi:F0F1-type ATP synthase assembly protein I